MPRETVAVDPDHIDVARAGSDAFFEQKCAFVDERAEAALDDLLIRDLASGEPKLRAHRPHQGLHFRVGRRGAASLLVAIPARPRLLAESTPLAQAVRDG